MQNDAPITSADLSGMVEHWLGTPPGGYLGQPYGADVKALVHSPRSAGLADGLIAKCREDIPLIGAGAGGSLNVYAYSEGVDRQFVVFEVAGSAISVGQSQ
jgi:hypothetical protein